MTGEQTSSDGAAPDAPPPLDPNPALITAAHLRFGWWSLLAFLSLGIALELLHGLKVGSYLDVSNGTRRFMWTLAHAHGTLLSLVHIAFAGATWLVPTWDSGKRKLASRSLCVASLMIPMGFFLGGVNFHSADPGIGILLLPAGAFLLFVSVLLTAFGMSGAARAS